MNKAAQAGLAPAVRAQTLALARHGYQHATSKTRRHARAPDVMIAGGYAGAYALGTAGAEFGAGFGFAIGGPVGAAVFGLAGGVVGGAAGYLGGGYALPRAINDVTNLLDPTPAAPTPDPIE